jgi:hypothetical protein
MSVRAFNDISSVLNGCPSYLGVIVATTTKNNHDTAVPFNNTGEALKGKVLLLQSDAAFYLLPGTTNAATVATSGATTGVLVAANERVVMVMGSSYGWVAAVAVSGTANVKVWELI